MKNILIVFGTRPEAIKLAPVIRLLKDFETDFRVITIVTGQHREMIDSLIPLFDIPVDYDLNLMEPNQDLGQLTASLIDGVTGVIDAEGPDLVVVQGDTTTAFCGALAAFYSRVPVAHVEAGLRTYHLRDPFPEEGNRRLISALAEIHFSPTERNRAALIAEGIPAETICVTGNTVVDSLYTILDKPFKPSDPILEEILAKDDSRLALVTSHRRESWGIDLRNVCDALRDLVASFPDLQIVFPVHMNPNVQSLVHRELKDCERIYLCSPLDYLTFVNLMNCADLILTDSGGIQEEAPSLNKPLLVLRQTTERPEAAENGLSRVVGTSRLSIVNAASQLLIGLTPRSSCRNFSNPFGDGFAADRIAYALLNWAKGNWPLLDASSEFKFAPEESGESTWASVM